jgi:hypothetical protein
MKRRINIFTGLFLTISITSCNNVGVSKNSLQGIIYKDISEVPPFKNYQVIGGELLPKYKFFDNKYAILHISNGAKHVLLFEDVTHTDPVDQAPKHEIIDTISIEKIEENESIVYAYCNQGTTADPSIIALVTRVDENAEFSDKIVRAWRIDFESWQIIPVKNTKGINCRLAWPE